MAQEEKIRAFVTYKNVNDPDELNSIKSTTIQLDGFDPSVDSLDINIANHIAHNFQGFSHISNVVIISAFIVYSSIEEKEAIGWKKKVPDKAGYWIRINAGNRPQLHQIFYMNRGDGDKLYIVWGSSDDSEPCHIHDIEEKLSYFNWIGRLPKAPKN